MIEIIKNFFDIKKQQPIVKEEKQSPTTVEEKHIEHKNKSKTINKVLGSYHSMHEPYYDFICNDNREVFMTKNMDRLIEVIKTSMIDHSLLSRVIRNISQKVAYNDFIFISPNGDKDKAELVAKRFKKILKDSNYTVNSFLRDNIYNLIQFSNSFTVPFREPKTNVLSQVLLVQNKGWHVDTAWGTSVARSFRFEPPEQNNRNTVYRNAIDVWHYTFNKSTDEIFGMPLWLPVIPLLRKKKYLEANAIDSYTDQSLTKTIFTIGVSSNGNVTPVNPEVYRSIIYNLQNNSEEDLIADVPITANTIEKEFSSPDKILETLEMQIIAGLYTSRSQLGENGAGRQDAETQQANTETIVEDFKVEFQNHLNNTFIKEICKDLFGNADDENEVLFVFSDTFNIKERKEKHATYLFQAGIIDLTEARDMCGRNKPINEEETFFKKYQQKEMNGTVNSTNNPSNQYGTTHTTKKTKKDGKI